MSTIYLPNDAGDVFYDASADMCFHKAAANPVCQAADTSLAAGDVTGIVAVTFRYDDDDVDGGSSHRTWTACQMCAAVQKHGGFLAEPASSQWNSIFTAPAAGIFRAWKGNGNSPSWKGRINGVETGWWVVSWHDSQGDSRPLRMASGDVLEMYNDSGCGDLTWFFCPYVYP